MKMNLQKELDELYIQVGETNGDVPDSIFERIKVLEDLINPPPKHGYGCFCEECTKNYLRSLQCECNDCWECVCRDSPEDI